LRGVQFAKFLTHRFARARRGLIVPRLPSRRCHGYRGRGRGRRRLPRRDLRRRGRSGPRDLLRVQFAEFLTHRFSRAHGGLIIHAARSRGSRRPGTGRSDDGGSCRRWRGRGRRPRGRRGRTLFLSVQLAHFFTKGFTRFCLRLRFRGPKRRCADKEGQRANHREVLGNLHGAIFTGYAHLTQQLSKRRARAPETASATRAARRSEEQSAQ